MGNEVTSTGPGGEPRGHRPGHEPLVVTAAPPERVGLLLAEARTSRGLGLHDVSEAIGGRLSPVEVLEVEAGRRALGPDLLREVTAVYGVDPDGLVPPRSQLVVDLNEGCLRAGPDTVRLSDGVGRRQVLSQYLELVYEMRAQPPGAALPLRDNDLVVLSTALEMDRLDVETTLRRMMRAMGDRSRVSRSRMATGAAVAVGTALATLLAWSALRADPSPQGSPTAGQQPVTTAQAVSPSAPPAAPRPGTTPAGAVAGPSGAEGPPPASALPPAPTAVVGPSGAVQERNPDGSAGPQQDR